MTNALSFNILNIPERIIKHLRTQILVGGANKENVIQLYLCLKSLI